MTVALRTATAGDAELLRALHRTGAAAELAGLPEAVLDAQHELRERAYLARAGAIDRIVVVDGAAVGRLLTAEADGPVRIVDLALLPEVRGRGVGTAVLRDELDRAADAGVPVVLRADRGSRPEALYRRLGFVDDGPGDAVRVALVRRP